MKKLVALTLSITIFLFSTGCAGKPESDTLVNNEPLSYSYGLENSGFYAGIRALDYIQLPEKYSSLEIPEEYAEVAEEIIDADLHEMMVNLKIVSEVTDRPVRNEDVVNIDFVGTINGVEFEGGSAVDYTVQLGTGNLLEEFEEQILGRNVGDSFDVTVIFPDGYGETTDAHGNVIDLSNRVANFHTTLKSIGVYELTDEAVANAFGDTYRLDNGDVVDTVEKARQYFEEYERYCSIVGYMTEFMMTNCNIVQEIPERIFAHEQQMEQMYAEKLAKQNGMPVEEFLAAGGYDAMEDYLSDSLEYIHQDVTLCFIIQAVAEDLGIQVTDADIEKAYGVDAQSRIDEYGKGFVAQQVLAIKVMDKLVA